jgi:RNA polymerase sigma-70 factor (ECF subfamily)
MQHHNEYFQFENEKFNGNNDTTFYQLYMKFFPKVKYFINYFVKSEAIAEDLSQDIFERIWMNRERFFNMEHMNAYLFRMAKNYSINYLQHKVVEKDFASSYIDFANLKECLTEEEIYAKELELLILLTVEKMPEQRRRIFEMSRIKNLKNHEIAKKLHISKKTVENHLSTALKQIREVISLSLIFFL